MEAVDEANFTAIHSFYRRKALEYFYVSFASNSYTNDKFCTKAMTNKKRSDDFSEFCLSFGGATFMASGPTEILNLSQDYPSIST